MRSAAVDPRIMARRVAVLRAQGRRRRRVLSVLAAAALAATAAWSIARTSLMDVDRIAVTGTDAARSAEILRSSALATGRPMLFLDLAEAGRSIESLPWVKSARAWRDWPATVRIEVHPRVAVAAVPAAGGRAALIDANGHAIAWATPDEPAGDTSVLNVAVPFSGDLGDIHTDADEALAVVAVMPDDLRAWVRAVTFDPAADRIGLDLRGGATVVLGEATLLQDKLSAARAVLVGAELDCITEIDVTMPDIAAVARHRPCLP